MSTLTKLRTAAADLADREARHDAAEATAVALAACALYNYKSDHGHWIDASKARAEAGVAVRAILMEGTNKRPGVGEATAKIVMAQAGKVAWCERHHGDLSVEAVDAIVKHLSTIPARLRRGKTFDGWQAPEKEAPTGSAGRTTSGKGKGKGETIAGDGDGTGDGMSSETTARIVAAAAGKSPDDVAAALTADALDRMGDAAFAALVAAVEAAAKRRAAKAAEDAKAKAQAGKRGKGRARRKAPVTLAEAA